MTNKIPKILVIDDEIMIHIILDQLISNYGFEPIRATDEKTAQEQLKEHTPDIILLDIMIPNCNSMALLQSIKSNPKLDNTRVIMISGTPDHDLIASYMNAGADDYVLKPFHATLLKSRILHALERVHKQKSSELVQEILSEVALTLRNITRKNENIDDIARDINSSLTGVLTCSHFLACNEENEEKNQQHHHELDIAKLQKIKNYLN